MVMLSELLRFHVVDRSGRRARLDDLALAVLEEDYPAVTELHFIEGKRLLRLPWDKVDRIGPGKQILVDDLTTAQRAEGEAENREVLLKHEILDALIIDLLNRRTTRANDLLLEEEGGMLRLTAADASISAMLRRITGGAIGPVNKEALYDWKYVEFLRGDPKAVENGEGYRQRIGRLPAGEIAQLADYVPYLHAAELLKILPDDKAADVMQAMSIQRQVQIIGELENDEASQLLRRMSPDLAADLAGRMHMGRLKHILRRMPRENCDRIVELLQYPPDSVGGVMINNMVLLECDTTVGEAKKQAAKLLENTDFVLLMFIVENDGRLKGSIKLRGLLANNDATELADIMDPYIASLEPFAPAHDAAYRIVAGQLAAMPVVEGDGKLIGAMTINAAIDQLVPESSSLRTLRVFS